MHRRRKKVGEKRGDRPRRAEDQTRSFFERLGLWKHLLWVPIFLALGSVYRRFGNHAADADTSAPFQVLSLPGKGKGMIALRDIKQGELILRESPLVVVPPKIKKPPAAFVRSLVSKLTMSEQTSFYDLSFVNLPKDVMTGSERYDAELALAIFQTNAVSAGDNAGLFPTMARLNHGCSSAFNAVYSFRKRENELFVHALKDIRKGEELLTSYTDTKRTREERRRYLAQAYDFNCTCSVCMLPKEASLASDIRLVEMTELRKLVSGWGRDEIEGDEAIKLIKRIWQLSEEEGYTSERGQLAGDAVWVAAAHSDALAMREWGEIALRWFAIELGVDSEYVVNMASYLQRPESHPAWATKRRLEVGLLGV